MTEHAFDQSTLVLNWTRGPQQGRSINIVKQKCLLKWRSGRSDAGELASFENTELPAPTLAIIQGPQGVALRAFGDTVELNGIAADSHWLRHGDRLTHDRFEAHVEFRCDPADTSLSHSAFSSSAAEPWDRLHQLLEQMSASQEHSSRMSRKIKSLARQTRKVARKCQRLDQQLAETAGPSLQSINEKLDAMWDKLSLLCERPVEPMAQQLVAEEPLAPAIPAWEPAAEPPLATQDEPANLPAWPLPDSPLNNLATEWQVEELNWCPPVEPVVETTPSIQPSANEETDMARMFSELESAFQANTQFSMPVTNECEANATSTSEPVVPDMYSLDQPSWGMPVAPTPVMETPIAEISFTEAPVADTPVAEAAFAEAPAEPVSDGSEVDLESILKRLQKIETNFHQEQERCSTVCLNEGSLLEFPSMPVPAEPVSLANEPAGFESPIAPTEVESKIEHLSQLYDSAINGNQEADMWSQWIQENSPAASHDEPVAAVTQTKEFQTREFQTPEFQATEPETTEYQATESPAEKFLATEFLATEFPATEFPAAEFPAAEFPAAEPRPTVELDSFGELSSLAEQELSGPEDSEYASDMVGTVTNDANRDELSRLRADLESLFRNNDEQPVDHQSTEFSADGDAAESSETDFNLVVSGDMATSLSADLDFAETETEETEPTESMPAVQPAAPVYQPAAGAEHDEGVTDYMNQLFQRLRVSPGSAAAPKAPEKPKAPAAVVAKVEVKTETVVAEEPANTPRVEFMAPDEFKPKQQAPERNTDMNALRNLANASVRSALDEFAEKQKHGLAALRYATAGGGMAFSVVLFAACKSIGDIWFLGGCGCLLASVACVLWHYRVAMQEAKLELEVAQTPDPNSTESQSRLEARLAAAIGEPDNNQQTPAE